MSLKCFKYSFFKEDEDEILGDDWMKAPLKFEDEGLKLAKDANTKVQLNELDKVNLLFSLTFLTKYVAVM